MSDTSMTRERMDEIVNEHFMYEANDDIASVMASLTDDAEHEVIPSPMGPLTERAQIKAYYEMLFPCLRDVSVTPVRRREREPFFMSTSSRTSATGA